jgi:deoxyribodipyrimidine photolyase-related protein
LINAGLILPNYILTKTLQYAQDEGVPINSTEGFVRQLIGWREFIRGMYICKGTYARTRNFWEFKRKIPASFYNGTTGIEPVDSVIKEVLKTGYCHHIERLMILGNFMLLCEFHPDDVYQWFMELFIDAYDWVMVPNVYGMSQFADGGTFATKPYISGSNYIKKMSNFGSGEWEQIWDGLFWRFMAVHQDFFKSNSRISMLYYAYQKMPEEKKQMHLRNANSFLERLG